MRGGEPGAALLALGLTVAATLFAGEEEAIPSDPEELIPRSFDLSLPDPEGLRHSLPGGAVAFVAPDPTVPLVEVVAVIPTGEAQDSPDRRGTAGLTASLLRRGGAGELGPDAFDRRVDRLAAKLDSFSGTHRSGAVLDVGSPNLEEGLDLLFAMLGEPRFDEGRFRWLRRNLVQGLVSQASDPAVLGSRAWERLTAGPDDPGRNPLEASEVADLRVEDLRDFHARHWRPERLVFAVAGAVEPRVVVEGVARRIRVWMDTASPAPPAEASRERTDPEPAVEPRDPGLWIVGAPGSDAVVLAGHRLEPTGSDGSEDPYATLALGELVAGEGAVNRMVGRLRTDLGLVYEVESELDLHGSRTGRWLTLFHCDPDDVGAALEGWLRAVERLRREPVDSEILAAARREILGSVRSRFDTASGIAGTYAEDLLVGRSHDFWLDLDEGLEKVDPRGVRNAARRLLRPEAVTVVVAGPEDRIAESLASAELPGPWREPHRVRLR